MEECFRGFQFDKANKTDVTVGIIELYQYLFDTMIVPVAELLNPGPSGLTPKILGENIRTILARFPNFVFVEATLIIGALGSIRNYLAHPFFRRKQCTLYSKTLFPDLYNNLMMEPSGLNI